MDFMEKFVKIKTLQDDVAELRQIIPTCTDEEKATLEPYLKRMQKSLQDAIVDLAK